MVGVALAGLAGCSQVALGGLDARAIGWLHGGQRFGISHVRHQIGQPPADIAVLGRGRLVCALGLELKIAVAGCRRLPGRQRGGVP